MSSITSANSTVMLSVAGLFPVPQKMQGYSADRAWETGNVGKTESVRGVDGRKSSGYIFNLVEQTFTFMADSPSIDFFDAVVNAMDAAREIFVISGTISLPAVGKSYICRNGTLKDAKPLANGGKVLEAQNYTIEWESITPTIS